MLLHKAGHVIICYLPTEHLCNDCSVLACIQHRVTMQGCGLNKMVKMAVCEFVNCWTAVEDQVKGHQGWPMQSSWMQQQQGPWDTVGGAPLGGSAPTQQYIHHAHNGLQQQHNRTLARSLGSEATSWPQVVAPVNGPFSTDHASRVPGSNRVNCVQQHYSRQESRPAFPKPPLLVQN